MTKLCDEVVDGNITMDDIVNEHCSEKIFCDEDVSISTPDTSLCSSVHQSSVSVSSYTAKCRPLYSYSYVVKQMLVTSQVHVCLMFHKCIHICICML